jgi:pimeloyl-ACP methyl ester carboxylesterase
MSNAAVRVDAVTGVEERLEHVSTPRGLLYSWAAIPPGATTCVLVCSPLFGEFAANYHRERQFGRLQALRGHGVIRFHYAGEGNSQGERRDMTFSSMCDDARAVLDHAESLGFSNFAVLGTRVGALVAAATVSALPSPVPLAIWEPVDDPLRFLDDAQRANRISMAAQGGGGEGGSWRHELERNGVLHTVGYDIYSAMVESLEGIDLVTALGTQTRAVFLARFRERAGSTDRIRDALVERGFSLRFGSYGLSESWWLHNERAPESGDLVTETVDWLSASLAETG